MHGGPDVVEELDLDDGLEAALRHAEGAADDVGFGEGRVPAAVGAEFGLQAGGELEDAALAFELAGAERFVAGGVGYVFAEDYDALVAAHLVFEAVVDELGHGALGGVGGLGSARCRSEASVGLRSSEY